MAPIRFARLSTLWALLLAASPLWAQPDSTSVEGSEIELEDLLNQTIYEDEVTEVVDTEDAATGAVSTENVSETPAIVAVIKQTEIQEFGANKLTDVLDRVVSMYMTGSFLYRQNNAVIRGDIQTHYNTHVLFLLDGRPVRESLFPGLDAAILNSFPVEAVERIEVLRGPGSVLYGTGAYTGVVNIITKKVSRSSISLRGGSFGTFRGEATVSKSYGDLNILASGQVFRQDGWEYEAFDADTVSNTIDAGERNIGLLAAMEYKGLTVKGLYSHTSVDVMGTSPSWSSTLSADGEDVSLERSFLDVGYQTEQIGIYSAAVNFTYNGLKNSSFTIAGLPSEAVADDYLFEVKNYFTPASNLKFILGALGTQVTGVNSGYFPGSLDRAEWVNSYDDLRWAAYTQLEYSPLPFLKLIGGVQANKIPDIDWDFVPRAGAIFNYQLDKGQTFGSKLLYGQAFRNPGQFELQVDFAGTLIGGQALEAEKVTTYDAQVYYQHTNYNFSVNYFYTEQDNLIARRSSNDPSRPSELEYANISELTSRGVEAEVKYFFIPNRLMFTGSFAWQENEIPGDESLPGYPGFSEDVSHVANRMIKAGMSYNNDLGSVGLFNSFFSEPSDVPNARTVNPDPSSFNLLSLNVDLNLSNLFGSQDQNAEFYFNFYGQNLLDEEIYDPEFTNRTVNSLPARPGRSLFAGFKVRFR